MCGSTTVASGPHERKNGYLDEQGEGPLRVSLARTGPPLTVVKILSSPFFRFQAILLFILHLLQLPQKVL